MNFKKRVNGSWTDTPNYIHKTDTDTITTLPAVLYPTGATATVGLKGQTTQSSIPSPTSPVMPEGTGERTGNLFDGNYTIAVMSVSGNTATLNTTSSGRTAIVKCEPNTTYTVKKYSASNRFIIAESDIKPANGTAMSIIQNDSSISEYTFTTSNTTQYVAVYCSTSSEQAEPQLMFNLGATAFPYENYGYKIPILSANTTTPVYLGEVQTTRKIRKYEFTGNEDTRLYSGTGLLGFELNIADMLTNSRTLGVSTHFKPQITGSGKTTDGITFGANNKTVYITLSQTTINTYNLSDISTIRSWLSAQYAAGTPVTVWYVLATEETGIVNEPLMRIGDYADTLSGITIPTIAGANTISVDTTVQPSEVTVNYKGWHPVQNVHERDNGVWT